MSRLFAVARDAARLCESGGILPTPARGEAIARPSLTCLRAWVCGELVKSGRAPLMDHLEHYARALRMVYAAMDNERDYYCPACGENAWDCLRGVCLNPDCDSHTDDDSDEGGEA